MRRGYCELRRARSLSPTCGSALAAEAMASSLPHLTTSSGHQQLLITRREALGGPDRCQERQLVTTKNATLATFYPVSRAPSGAGNCLCISSQDMVHVTHLVEAD